MNQHHENLCASQNMLKTSNTAELHCGYWHSLITVRPRSSQFAKSAPPLGLSPEAATMLGAAFVGLCMGIEAAGGTATLQ